MKNILTILALFLAPLLVLSQQRIIPSQDMRDLHLIKSRSVGGISITGNNTQPYIKSSSFLTEESSIGDTRYDNQSNASIPNRICLFDDGTIGATWTRSMQEPMFADRGTGYNYFDGTQWGLYPESRIENIQTHRPTYTHWGATGEMVVSHASGSGLFISTRGEKGTGTWNFSSFSGPSGQPYILWNRAIASGTDYNRLHILALTLPTTHGGTPYMGLDGALLYSWSTDGGQSWYWQNEVLEGMASDEYTGFSADIYTFAEPKEDVVAFVVGDS
ncbi:MAG: hypothetical protein FJY07_07075, partial [Bacteroidetes bacterium]|nr:hypothetical protein [Bacteroidota bacterium]